jgi:hypothetical protein
VAGAPDRQRVRATPCRFATPRTSSCSSLAAIWFPNCCSPSHSAPASEPSARTLHGATSSSSSRSCHCSPASFRFPAAWASPTGVSLGLTRAGVPAELAFAVALSYPSPLSTYCRSGATSASSGSPRGATCDARGSVASGDHRHRSVTDDAKTAPPWFAHVQVGQPSEQRTFGSTRRLQSRARPGRVTLIARHQLKYNGTAG